MASTFMGLSIAGRGLSASQVGLSVTTNNISNVNTTGYSRQVVNQVAVGPAAVYSSNYVGSGTDVTSVDRVRSFRLDQKYWQENSSLNEWSTKDSTIEELQNVLGTSIDSTDEGFAATLNAFYSALSDVSADASSSSARAELRETGEALCSYLNDAANQLTQLRSDINSDINTSVNQINTYAQQIADLNQRITIAANSGASTNELEDQRDALIDSLSSLTSVQVTQVQVGSGDSSSASYSYTVTVGGETLVNGSNARQLETYVIDDGSTQDGMYGIRWSDTGTSFEMGSSGSLKAQLDLRDGTGEGGEYKGIVYYQNQLDDFARTFAEAFNEGIYKDGSTSSYGSGHASGYGLDGSTGVRFFSYDDKSSTELMATGTDTAAVYKNITAANISLSSDVEDDLNKIAAASASDEESNNENIQALISICNDSAMFANGTPVDAYNSIITALGTSGSYASQQNTIKTDIVDYVDKSRSSVSGVSTNEETANITKYQQAYEASAKSVSTWSEIYETTINMVNS